MMKAIEPTPTESQTVLTFHPLSIRGTGNMMIRSCDLIEVSELIHLHKGFVPIVHYGLSERIIAKISQNRTKNYCMVSIGFFTIHLSQVVHIDGGWREDRRERRRKEEDSHSTDGRGNNLAIVS
jgi:hypothetical protein